MRLNWNCGSLVMMKWFFSESRNIREVSTPTRRQRQRRRRRLVVTRTSWDDDVSGDDTDSTFKQESPVILELQHPTKNAEIKDMVPFLSRRHRRRPRHRRMSYLRQQHHSTTSGGDDDDDTDTVNTSSTLALIDVPNGSIECSKGTCGVFPWMETFDRQVSDRGQEFLSSPSCLGATSLPCSTTPIDAALLIPTQGHTVVDVEKHHHVSFRLELNVWYDAPSPLVRGPSTSSSSYNDDDDDNDDNKDDGHPPSLWYNGLHLRSMERHVRAKVEQLLEYDTIQLLYGNDNDSTDHSIDKEEDSFDSTHEDEEDDNTMTMDHDNDWFHKHRHHFHCGVGGRYKTRLSCSKSSSLNEWTNHHDRCRGCSCSSIVRMWRHILERCSRPNICPRHEANFFHHVLLPEQQAFLIAWTQSSNLGFERWIVARIQASAAKATSSSSSSTIVMTSSTGGGTIHHPPPCGAVVAVALNSTITSRQQLVQVVLGLQSVMREEVTVAVAACSNSNSNTSTTMPAAAAITDTTTTTTTEQDDILVADHGRERLEQQVCCCLQQSSQRLSRPSRRLALCIAMAQHEQAVFL